MARTLTMTSPATRGTDVAALQRDVNRLAARWGLRLVPVDGEYGPLTGGMVKAAKYRLGFPRGEVNTGAGPRGQDLIRAAAAGRQLPAAYRARAATRAAAGWRPGWGSPPSRPVPQLAADRMVAWARAGLIERPAQSNVVPELVNAAGAAGVAPAFRGMGWPWCMFACFLAALPDGMTARLAMVDGKVPLPLYTVAVLEHARAHRYGLVAVSRSGMRAGDLVFMDFDGGGVDHVGRFLEWTGPGTFRSVEGNTSGGPGGSQSNGGGVFIRERSLSLVGGAATDS